MGLRGYDHNLEPVETSWACSACDESGWLCLEDAPCRLPDGQPSPICEREHVCPMCKGQKRIHAE